MNILINRTDAIGDTILTMPLAQLFKESIPNCSVYFLVHPRVTDLFINQTWIDGVWTWDKKLPLISRLKKLKEDLKNNKINYYVYVGGDHWPSFLSFCLRVAWRGGIKSRLPSFLWLNHGVRQRRSEALFHETEYNFTLISELLKKQQINLESLRPIQLTAEEKFQGNNFLTQFLKSSFKNIVIIHPGMTGHTLNWPIENYAQLILDLAKSLLKDDFILLSFTPSDEVLYINPLRAILAQHQEILKYKVIFFDGSQMGLRHSLKVFSQAKLFIGPSTGTVHMASCLGVTTIALYSPIRVQSAKRWAPLNHNSESVIFAPSPVVDDAQRSIMKQISVFEVLERAKNILGY